MDLLGLNLIGSWVYGSLLMLTSLGLTMVFGLGRVVNFAVGVFYALGAFFLLTFVPRAGGFWPVLLLGPIIVALIALVLERTIIRRFRGSPEIYTMLVTFALAILFAGIIQTGWEPRIHFVEAPVSGTFPILGVMFPKFRIVAGAIAMAAGVAVWLAIHGTTAGLRIRGASENGMMASMLGIDTLRVLTLVFGLAAGMAAFAGVLAGPIFSVRSTMAGDFLIDSFLAVVIGGLGSLRGAILGAYLIAVIKNVSVGFVEAEFATAISFALVALILVLRPSGIFGEGRVA